MMLKNIHKLKRSGIIILMMICPAIYFSQSNNCTTATQVPLTSGTACVNGTSAGAVTDNILYGTCNTAPVNMVWYTYVANGSNNSFTITPGTLTNAEIVIYLGGCPNTGTLQTCATATGATPLVTSWGMAAGNQVWVGIASNGGVSGSFQFCVNSQPPAPGAGNTCAQAIPLCNMNTFTQNPMVANSSGQTPTCFASAPQTDIWLKFTISQAGTLAWTAMPSVLTTEFDWALWDVTAGCPGTLVCCNYNYAGGSTNGFGMQNSTGNVACGTSAGSLDPLQEFSPPITVTCGQVYAIQISNFNNTTDGFSLSFPNSTCLVGSTSNFSVSPALICGPSLNAAITNSSTGTCNQVWNFGDGSATYTGGTPPNHNYTTPGTYAITASVTGACPASFTQYVQLLAPLAATVTPTPVSCPGACNGVASVSAVTGGNGVYTYSWSTGATTNQITGLCTGVYSVTISNTVCGSTITKTVSITAPPPFTVTPGSNSPVCAGATLSLTATGGTTYSWSGPGGYTSAAQNPTIPSISPANAGVYTVTATTTGCSSTATVNVTIAPSPTVTVSSATICAGASTTLSATGANTYTWNPPTGLSSVSGNMVTASPAATTIYTVSGSVGSCTANPGTGDVSVNPTPTVTAGSNSPICVGAAINLTSSGGATYAWSGPAAYTSASQNPTIASAAAANAGVYTVTATTASGCIQTNTVNVSVVASPTVAVSSNTPCPGATFSLTAASDGTSYNWSGPGAYTSTVQNPTIANAGPATAGIYTAVVSNTTGCSTTSTVNATVNAAASPTASSSGTICAGQTLTLTVSSAGAGATYQWTGPNGFTSAIQSPAIANAPVANSGVYTVTVTSAAGCSGTTTVNAQVNAIPVVTIGSNSPICAGTALSLTSGGGTTYAWSGPGAYTSAIQNPTIASASVVNTGVYTVTATTSGCSATNTVNVTVNALPSPTVSSNSPVCSGAAINLMASGGTTYSWSGPGAYTSVSQNPSISPADPTNTGVYTVTATTAGCSASGTVNVTVNATPTVTIGSNSPICAGTALNLTSGGGTIYAWSGPGAYTSTMQNPVINPALAANSGVYTVTATTAGCSATNTVNVTVNTAVIASINPLPQACLNSTVNLSAPNGANTYAWSGPNGFTSAQQNPQITGVTGASAGVYSLTLTTSGCASTATANLAVTGPVSFSVVPAGQAVCKGGSVSLSALGQGGTGVYGYNWSPATGISTPNAPSVTASPNTTQTYTVTLSDVNCPTAPTATTVVTVTINPLPVITFSTPAASGCETFCTSFSSQSVPAAQTSTWIFGNGQTASGANPGPICFSPHGSYSVKLIVQDINGCVDSLNKPGYITVYPKPVADFTWDPLSPTIITSEVHFYDQSAVGGPMHQWHWDFGDFYVPFAADTTNSQNPSHIYSSIGSYNVMLAITNQYGCRDTVTKKITVEDEFAFYIPNAFTPNEPDGVNDIFNVKGTGFLSDSFEMYIFDRWGEQIYFTDNVMKGWDGTAKGSGVRAKQDVYVYKIVLKDFQLKKRQYVGHVTLL